MDRQMWETKGYALVTSLIVVAIAAGLALGFLAQVNTQQKIGYNDRDYSTAFYAAEAGLEKMNSDLNKQFQISVTPTAAQLALIQSSAYQPNLPGVTYTAYTLTGGQFAHLNGALTAAAATVTVDSTAGWPATGYFMIDAEYMTYTGLTATTLTGVSRGGNGTVAAAHSNNARVSRSQVITVAQGPNSGLNAQVIPFTLQIVAQATSGTEAKLNRDIQVALVPVFQFGVFSDSDLSFFAGPDFTMAGRVHTNGNLFLAEGSGTLTLQKKVTTALDVIRTQLSNGYATNVNYASTVNVVQTPGVYRALALNEGSLTGGPGSAANGAWHALSLTTYNGNILNGATGAKKLTLPFVGPNASNIEIIRRPPAGEDTQTLVSESRLYNQASLRILLSDAAASLPGGVGYQLSSALSAAPYNAAPYVGGVYTADATHPPFAVADPLDADYQTGANTQEAANTALIDGFIKVEMQKNDNTWQDVTMEILNLGISGGNDVAAAPNANAILRFEKLKPTKASGSTTATDYMPISLYDTREARFRDSAVPGLRKIGVMGIVELDVNNLSRWFAGIIGANGGNALNNSGYIFYFSDRRGNQNAAGNETGEFGFEDTVNSGDAANGVPNNGFEAAEDFNQNGTLETYGGNLLNPFTAYPGNTDLYTTPVDIQSTTLNQAGVTNAAPANGGTLTVTSTAWAAAAGFFTIDNEAFMYTGKTATTFTGLTRGAFGTTAAAHPIGTTLFMDVQYTTLNQAGVTNAAPANGAALTVASTANWPAASGFFVIDNEAFTFGGKTATTFTGIARGAYGTTAASHNNGVVINVGQSTTLMPTTTLGQAVSTGPNNPATGGTLTVASTLGFTPGGGSITTVGGEIITYAGTTATTFTNITRGANGSAAAAAANGTTITAVESTVVKQIMTAASPGVGQGISVNSTLGFPPSGSITIGGVGGEVVTYSSMTATGFVVAGRGQYGSAAAGHAINSVITGEQILSATNPKTGQTIGMASTAGWGSSGYLLIGNEYITYSNKAVNPVNGQSSVTVQTRGAFGTGGFSGAWAPGVGVFNAARSQKNRVRYFRRTLRLINGKAPNLPTPGFTVASENPVYVLGDYNADGAQALVNGWPTGVNGAHSYAAVIADAVTFLSNNWTDSESFDYQYDPGGRNANTSWYRMAIAGGKGINFAQPAGQPQDYGTDGGTHNFLRYIENWGGSTLNYLGSIVSLYFSHQATGTYKCCTIVYSPPTRNYTFDSDFLSPSQLPPGTPRFRDVNNLSFRQYILSTQ